mgnify:CR=1 FL=1|tara:strand:- start:7776 stop:8558 length:783 start_codon:yes stop_codon:yes gene_type:complete
MKKAFSIFLISFLGSCNTSNPQGNFPNYIDTNSLRIFARDGVSISFLNNVGEAYGEMFSDNSNIDSIMRSNYLTISLKENVYQRVGVEGMASSNFDAGRPPIPFDENATDYIWELNSGGEDQIGEVIEHLLHTVTNVILYLTYPNDWDYNDSSSALRIAMQEAIDKGVYDISSYDDLKNDNDIYHKILTQEYAYWLILAEWDYYEITGKKINGISGNEEFIIGTPSEITNQLPLGHKLYEDYLEKILSIPNVQKIVSLFS